MHPQLTIVRGHQGSGKTTHALSLVAQEPGLLHFENDQFLQALGQGAYAYSPDKHAQARQQCLDAVRMALEKGERVLVASTFTTLADMQPYLELVKGAMVRVVEMFGDYPNTHQVPQAVVEAKKAAFEPYPGAEQVRSEPIHTTPRKPSLK